MIGGTRHAVPCLGLLLSLSLAGRAGAQLPSVKADSSQWHFVIAPYGWLTGLNGRVGVGPIATNADLGPGQILGAIQGAAMGYVEVRRGPWVLGVDGIYAKLGANKVIAFRGDTGSFTLTIRETILSPTVGYSIGDSTWTVDFVAGARYWNLNAGLDVARPRASHEFSGTRPWTDAIGGLRFRWVPLENVRVMAAADGGAGGSHSTWQGVASVGYDAWSTGTVSLAYRILKVDYDHDNFLYDVRMNGFLIGVTFRF
jgi:hypothetical protein